MTAPVRLIVMALAMGAVLIAMAGLHAAQRAGGTEIRLDMLAVDPRDPLLGHYVVIETPLHRLDLNAYGPVQTGFSRGSDVYVSLRRDSETGTWTAASVHDRHPGEGVVIRGKVERVMERVDQVTDADGERVRDRDSARSELRVHYNLERYYASRDEALELEYMREEARLRLIVSVSNSGNAVIKGLEIDGEDRLDRLF
ncbi:GDYXXLXY domain-containing protein [Hyphomonadaceae bacterium BL14]|nr:GDYXXLXY domain-containing protein [Hyphomonadaceae bacterium BL14]